MVDGVVEGEQHEHNGITSEHQEHNRHGTSV